MRSCDRRTNEIAGYVPSTNLPRLRTDYERLRDNAMRILYLLPRCIGTHIYARAGFDSSHKIRSLFIIHRSTPTGRIIISSEAVRRDASPTSKPISATECCLRIWWKLSVSDVSLLRLTSSSLTISLLERRVNRFDAHGRTSNCTYVYSRASIRLWNWTVTYDEWL